MTPVPELHEGETAAQESAAARAGMDLPGRGPALVCDWLSALFIHFECNRELLQSEVPFPLHLRGGRAYVSLVAFTINRLRPMQGGRLGELLFRPVGTHGFLNVRTYVEYDGEPGIYFLVEWLPNRLSVLLGPALYGLPYNFGTLNYSHDQMRNDLRGRVRGAGGLTLSYSGAMTSALRPSEPGTLPHFLLERYTAFTSHRGAQRVFRVWHEPWQQADADISLQNATLLRARCPWFDNAKLIGANYSPGVRDVWMSAPRKI